MFKKILISLGIVLIIGVTGVQAQTIAPETKIDYYLPYPGLLPDHPLYWLKMIRDRVQLWLTTEGLPKGEKLLLYADKRLGAGWALMEGNKKDLGITTLTKAEKYLEQAVSVGQKLGEGEKEVKFKARLAKAIKKHEEVLSLLNAEPGGDEEADQLLEEVEVSIDFGDEEAAVELVEAKTAFEALQMAAENRGWELAVKEYDFGSLVEAINGRKNTSEKAWIYFINGQAATQAADKQELNAGDVVEWKYEKPIY
ncbi:MAG: DUF5667 domain-containing protein [Patescibacteria group bacterium]|nr:DUF5667 domain-containing protein [Patescibacteria group bacterium]